MAQEVRLLINIVSAHVLRNAAPDLFQKTIVEPYCICEIMGREDPNAPTFRTKSRPNGDAPLWNEVTQIVIEQGEALIFMVNYKDDDSEDDVIGWAKLEFGTMLPHGFKGELNLTDAAASKVLPAFLQVDVKPIPFQEDLEDLEAQPASPEPPPLAPMSSHFAEDPSLPQDDATADLEKEVPETQERMLPGHTDDTWRSKELF